MGGVNKCLEILDKKREALLSATDTAPSLIQVDSDSVSDSVSATGAQSALSVLQAKASKMHNLRLALLAAKLRKAMPEGAFSQVLSEIEKMIKNTKAEAARDMKEKDTCTKEYFEFEQKTKKLVFLSKSSATTIEKIEDRVATMKGEKSSAEEEIGAIESDLNQSLTFRTEENAAFKSVKADKQKAIEVLGETSKALKKYYEEVAAKQPSLLQADPHMSDKRKKLKNEEHEYSVTSDLSQEDAASAILAMLDNIADTLRHEIASGMEEENAAQLDYEKSKDLLLVSKAKLEKKTVSLESIIAEEEQQKNIPERNQDHKRHRPVRHESL